MCVIGVNLWYDNPMPLVVMTMPQVVMAMPLVVMAMPLLAIVSVGLLLYSSTCVVIKFDNRCNSQVQYDNLINGFLLINLL